jgi:hypothetical protein
MKRTDIDGYRKIVQELGLRTKAVTLHSRGRIYAARAFLHSTKRVPA